MGKHKFRLSDMIPNAWFYKLIDMSKATNQRKTQSTHKKHQPTSSSIAAKPQPKPRQPHLIPQRKSYYFSRNLPPSNLSTNPNPSNTHFPDQPRISSKKKQSPKRNTLSLYSPRVTNPTNKLDAKFKRFDGFDPDSGMELTPIITKSDKGEDMTGISSKEQRNSPVRKFSVNSPGLKLRTNSPKFGIKRVQVHGRKMGSSSGLRSMAVVKKSQDPQRDFKESMVEMIIENNIRASKDLEDLLACYLFLNSDEYHDLIIKVFMQIWFDVSDKRIK